MNCYHLSNTNDKIVFMFFVCKTSQVYPPKPTKLRTLLNFVRC